MSSIVQLRQLSKVYRNGRGAHEVSFALEEGQVFGLLGANGAGKTTVMKMLSGLCQPTSGELSLFGSDLESEREAALSQVGTLIEAPAFYGYLTGRQNLKLAARFYPEQKIGNEKIDETLEMVGMLPYGNEKAARYSLGMKQRLGIALAMIGSPRLYILDEPSNGLDIEGRVEIRNIILRLAERRDATFIICSHLSDEIQRCCDSVGIMKDGRLLATETMDQILSRYPALEDYYLEQIGGSSVRSMCKPPLAAVEGGVR